MTFGMNPNSRKLPPGQQLAAPGRWPIIGERAPMSSAGLGSLEICGLVDHPRPWSLGELENLPQIEISLDIHCVTRWSILDMTFSGVLLEDVLNCAGVHATARYISFVAHSARGHSTSLAIRDALDCQTLIAVRCGGAPLSVEHGGPIRNIVPHRYFYKSVKWLTRIELLAEDRLGFWEAESGYHNGADPWREQRYMAPTIDRRTAARLIDSRDFSRHDLRSIDAQGHDLTGLRAVEALLRDANFRRTVLRNADFTRANLSNAHFERADLHGAIFRDADVEGANFAGANLRGADFTGASLIGCSFCDPIRDDGQPLQAVLDPQTTVLPQSLWSPLAPEQIDFLIQSGFGTRAG